MEKRTEYELSYGTLDKKKMTSMPTLQEILLSFD